MSRQITQTIYKFSELSETAKERAKQDSMSLFGYSWADDALESIKALAKHFGGTMSNWEIDWFNCSYSSAKFEMPDDLTRREIRKRLLALGDYDKKTFKSHGDCKLTGYCADDDAIDGFRKAFLGDGLGLEESMQAAFETWLKASQSDCEAQYEDDEFSEHCDANNYEFFDNGEIA